MDNKIAESTGYVEPTASENISVLRTTAVVFSVIGALASLVIGLWLIIGKHMLGYGCIVSIGGFLISCVFGITCFMILDLATDVRRIRISLDKKSQ